MGDLQVSTAGLATLATTFESAADDALVRSAPFAHSTFHASASAVQAVNAEISISGLRIADRLTVTGEQVTSACAAYGACDASAADRLGEF